MSRPIIFICLFVVACAYAASTYTTKYDNIDLDEILSNDRIYQKYFECLANKGKCTPDGKELKDALPDALKTGCQKCSEKQKHGAEKVLKHLLEHKKADYDVLEKLYDPEGIYRKKNSQEAPKDSVRMIS